MCYCCVDGRETDRTIHTATFMDELSRMEKGTRPGVSQLAFYASADGLQITGDGMPWMYYYKKTHWY